MRRQAQTLARPFEPRQLQLGMGSRQQRLEQLRSRQDELVDRLLQEAQAELEGLQERLDGLLDATGD